MSIKVQPTPNPNARKFVLPFRYFDRSMNFSDMESAAQIPLARELFGLPGVYNLLLAQDFVTINKLPGIEWPELEAQVIRILDGWVTEQKIARIDQSQRTQE